MILVIINQIENWNTWRPTCYSVIFLYEIMLKNMNVFNTATLLIESCGEKYQFTVTLKNI